MRYLLLIVALLSVGCTKIHETDRKEPSTCHVVATKEFGMFACESFNSYNLAEGCYDIRSPLGSRERFDRFILNGNAVVIDVKCFNPLKVDPLRESSSEAP